uniref:DNA-directed RNA polymerase n=1 Tax=Kalanchoe fedtschenkoi TaxID=63787 RepID=A0A7N0U2Z9_KALFE
MSGPSGSLPRCALADTTNQSRKRVFDGYGGKRVDDREDGADDILVSKQVCVGLEKKLSEVGGVEDLNVGGSGVAEENESGHILVEADDVSRNSCVSIPLVHAGSDSCNGDTSSGEVLLENAVVAAQSGSLRKTYVPGDCEVGDKDVTVAYLNIDQSESSESAKLVKPSRVQPFEIERCTSQLEGHSNSSLASAAEMLKTCFCSFCLKAAYIWSDLHCQDVKGRISALKKSKKEAFNLFQRICMGKEPKAHDQGSSDVPSKLDSDLSDQWRSLFLHMEEAFARETNHYKDQFLALEDLRENCKINLEMVNAKPADHD